MIVNCMRLYCLHWLTALESCSLSHSVIVIFFIIVQTNKVTKTTAITEFTGTTTTTTTEAESRCSNEATDSSGNHLRPEDDNLTILKYEDNPTIEQNSEEECNTFEPKEGAIAGE